MAIVKQILLFCDVQTSSCYANAYAEGDDCMDVSVGEVRRSAKDNGWSRNGGKDICPECKAHESGNPRYIYKPPTKPESEG